MRKQAERNLSGLVTNIEFTRIGVMAGVVMALFVRRQARLIRMFTLAVGSSVLSFVWLGASPLFSLNNMPHLAGGG